MASRSGMLIFTWLNIFKIFSICELDLLFFSLFAKGIVGLCTFSADLFFSFSSDSEVVGLEFADVEALVGFDFCWMVTGGEKTWLSTCFPDLKIWAMLH